MGACAERKTREATTQEIVVGRGEEEKLSAGDKERGKTKWLRGSEKGRRGKEHKHRHAHNSVGVGRESVTG